MSTTETELKVDERLKETTSILEQYSQSLGLNAIGYNPEVEKILKLSSQELKELSEEDALAYGYILSNYSAFLSREKNSQSSKLKWATHNLNIVVGKNYGNYGNDYTKYEVRLILIINDNEYASLLNQIILKASTRVEQINGIDFQITRMADFLKEIAKSKRYNHE